MLRKYQTALEEAKRNAEISAIKVPKMALKTSSSLSIGSSVLLAECDEAYALIGSQFHTKIIPEESISPSTTPGIQSYRSQFLNHITLQRYNTIKRLRLTQGVDKKDSENNENLLSEIINFSVGSDTFDRTTAAGLKHFPLPTDPRELLQLKNEMVGRHLLDEALFVNFDRNEDKYYQLLYMARKLFAFAKGKCWPESVDGPKLQEVLLPGQVLLVLLKQKLQDYLLRLKQVIIKKLGLLVQPKSTVKIEKTDPFLLEPSELLPAVKSEDFTHAYVSPKTVIKLENIEDFSATQINSVDHHVELLSPEFLTQCLSLVTPITKAVENFFSTGNLVLREATSLQQVTGYTIITEKINYLRYLSHFRSVHRGSHFTKTRISSIRKLTPDSWGFLCAVHTPDGAPCGLLNHFTSTCQVVGNNSYFSSVNSISNINKNRRRVTFDKSTTKLGEDPGMIGDEGGLQNSMKYVEHSKRLLNALRSLLFVKSESSKTFFACKCPGDILKNDCYYYPLFLDGILVAWVPEKSATPLESQLRRIKCYSTFRNMKEFATESIDDLSTLNFLTESADKIDIQLPWDLEIVFILRKGQNGDSQHPGLFLFSTFSRMIRPVQNLNTRSVEFIGTFEQIYLNVAVDSGPKTKDQEEATFQHEELKPTCFLSILANLIPFSDFNQSPRNMYQCQMCKQTMGTTHYSLPFRAENKSYRLQTPQRALVKPIATHASHHIEDYPSGTNAIVAVISYTGYDMEDAMVINKGSEERGFAHGFVYKTDVLEIEECVTDSLLQTEPQPSSGSANTADSLQQPPLPPIVLKDKDKKTLFTFGFNPDTCVNLNPSDISQLGVGGTFPLDSDGLPHVGALIYEGAPYYSYVNIVNGKCKIVRSRSGEAFVVDRVFVQGSSSTATASENDFTSPADNEPSYGVKKALIYTRMRRNPMIGDKFASRQGQKGICSFQMAHEDLPFTESGIVPDIIFNPHGFPSRMTIGMIIECMAGKSASLNGTIYDATPFTLGEKKGGKQASHHFSELLEKSGYDYYGTEIMYSGLDGRMLDVDIFTGVIYYQRLRHMVADKFQVRTTGPVDALTHQPLKGRKRSGGIRCGEMERDALIAHGASFLLSDRLLNCSDPTLAPVCVQCKSLVSPCLELSEDQKIARNSESNKVNNFSKRRRSFVDPDLEIQAKPVWKCKLCGNKPVMIRIPYVLKYLTYELMALNIKLECEVKDIYNTP